MDTQSEASFTQQLTSFPLILTEGGDDRLGLNEKTGVNKYFCKPDLQPELNFRGSCTCNIPSVLGYEAAERAYEMLKQGETTIDTLMS